LRDTSDARRIAAASNDLDIGLDWASHLIGQLLRMARLDADASPTQARTVDLAEFARERVALLIPLADARGQTLDVAMPDAVWGGFDVDAIGAIVDNLIDNAIKYADPNTLIRVQLRAARAQGEIVFTVVDRGLGIDPTLREEALARFGRAGNQDAPGAGLGLSIVQRAARRLGGQLSLLAASSASGGCGLCAQVRFPGSVQTDAAQRLLG
jgi:signal transduction histidine kinase